MSRGEGIARRFGDFDELLREVVLLRGRHARLA